MYSKVGTIYFTKTIIDWIAGEISSADVLNDRNITKILGADSMNHVMKGNIGFFISGGKDIVCKDLQVSNITNEGKFNRKRGDTAFTEGEKAFTHAIVASENIAINGEKYSKNTFI